MIQATNTIKDYHSCRTHVSRGMLADLAKRPRLFEGRYITGEIPSTEPTAAMQIGTAIHALALEGRDTLVSCPAEYLASNGAMSTKAAKDWKAQVEADGYTVANAETTERIKRASAAVLAYLASQQIDPEKGIVERPIYWERSDGIACRALPDLLVSSRLCIDLKTTSDLSDRAISSACFGDFSYWLQVVHYLEGIKETYGYDANFVFVFVETERPYGVRAYSLSADDHAWAFNKRERLIEDLKRRTELGDWSDPEEGGICEFKRPGWCK